jgi:preprotein translocase subunit Sec63
MARLVILVLLLVVVVYALLTVGRGDARAREGVAPARVRMTRHEALLVLGLAEGASSEDIERAHRQLIRKLHPDTPGGSTYLTSQINQARDVLLR